MAGKLAKRLADAVFAAIKSQCLSPFRKGFYAFTEGTSGAEGVFREDGFAPFSYMALETPRSCVEKSKAKLQKLCSDVAPIVLTPSRNPPPFRLVPAIMAPRQP